MIIYVLSLSDMRGQVDRQRIVAWSLDPKKLQDWMESFLVEPYKDEPSADFFGYVRPYQKVFAKGSPLEWFNPPMGGLQGVTRQKIPEEDFSDWKKFVRFIE